MPASIVHIGSVDAIELLTADHSRLKRLFTDFDRVHSDSMNIQAEQIARRICGELTIHMTVEEEIFYPEVRAAIAETGLVKEAKVEHSMVKELIGLIMAGSIHDRKYAAQVKVLGECVRRHMQVEEAHMFRRAREADVDMNEIGARIIARRHDLEMESGLAERSRTLQRRRSDARRKTARARNAVQDLREAS
jgi:iron-sulfur cluster repair protein YtfE (RIC family)